MAKATEGFLGGFSGKLGPVVGYQWNGKWCMRTRPDAVRNPRTQAQQEQRALFTEEVRLASHMRWAVTQALTQPARAAGMTAFNLFVSINQPAFSLADGRLAVDYAALQLSMGPVAPVALSEVQASEGTRLEVKFDRNPLHMSSNQYDSVYLYVYAPELELGFLASPVYRREQRLATVLPDMFADTEVHLYAYVVDGQGRTSATAYGGSLVVGATAATVVEADGMVVDTATGEVLDTAPTAGSGRTSHADASSSAAPPRQESSPQG